MKKQTTKVNPDEAIKIFRHTTISSVYTAVDLYETFKLNDMLQDENWESINFDDLARLVTFMYETGRIQGIRESRSLNKRSATK